MTKGIPQPGVIMHSCDSVMDTFTVFLPLIALLQDLFHAQMHHIEPALFPFEKITTELHRCWGQGRSIVFCDRRLSN